MKARTLYAPANRLLLILQFWEGDKKQAMKLARLIADLQPGRCDLADFLFLSRYDCEQDRDTIEYVSRKFNVYSYKARRHGTGWPHGCNELWFSGMDWFYGMMSSNKIPKYKAAFTFEADCAPLQPSWINVFSSEWDEQVNRKPTFIYGAELHSPGWHINGNMLVSGHPAFLDWLVRKKGGVSSRGGWDYILANDFKKWGAYNFPKLKSYWGTPSFSEDAFNIELDRGTVFIHGIKDTSLLKLVRKRFLG